jgi:hypothetical protein
MVINKFEESNFKSYLRNYATRDWFSKSIDNVRYKEPKSFFYESGLSDEIVTSGCPEYADKYTVSIVDVIIDGSICSLDQRQAGFGSYIGGMTLIGLGGVALPFTAGGSIALSCVGATMVTGGDFLKRSGYSKKICFKLSKDNSE